jgi:hypothetical protein
MLWGRLFLGSLIALLIMAVFMACPRAAFAFEQNEEIQDQIKEQENQSKRQEDGWKEQESRVQEEQSGGADKGESASNEPPREKGVVFSSQMLHSEHGSSGLSLLFEAENAKRYGDLDQAITFVRRSLDVDDSNLDAHAFYADVLEAKLKKQTERDPEMFRTCIQEWLIVMRNKVGDERGLNIHGIGIPAMGTAYEDEDHTIKARQHLTKLTGFSPKPWETDTRYLKRVLAKTTESVSGKIVKKKPTKASEFD